MLFNFFRFFPQVSPSAGFTCGYSSAGFTCGYSSAGFTCGYSYSTPSGLVIIPVPFRRFYLRLFIFNPFGVLYD